MTKFDELHQAYLEHCRKHGRKSKRTHEVLMVFTGSPDGGLETVPAERIDACISALQHDEGGSGIMVCHEETKPIILDPVKIYARWNNWRRT